MLTSGSLQALNTAGCGARSPAWSFVWGGGVGLSTRRAAAWVTVHGTWRLRPPPRGWKEWGALLLWGSRAGLSALFAYPDAAMPTSIIFFFSQDNLDVSLGISDALCRDEHRTPAFRGVGNPRAFLLEVWFFPSPFQKAALAKRCPQTGASAILMECYSILCFLNEASFPCMQISGCRQLVL